MPKNGVGLHTLFGGGIVKFFEGVQYKKLRDVLAKYFGMWDMKSMKSMWPHLVEIFFMTYFTGLWQSWSPEPPQDPLLKRTECQFLGGCVDNVTGPPGALLFDRDQRSH